MMAPEARSFEEVEVSIPHYISDDTSDSELRGGDK